MNSINPEHYTIHLEPDLNAFRFSGWEEILLTSEGPVEEISLDAVDLAVWSCTLLREETRFDCPFQVDPGQEELKILLPKGSIGRMTLRIEYMGNIRDGLSGFYRTRYRSGGENRYAAVTQFEESDARRAFPCFDHPSRKATFDIELVLDERLTALSNGPVTEETRTGGGRKLVRFKRTPKMSTYLLFFGAGEFEFISDPDRQRVRVVTVPGMTRHGKFALDFGVKALDFCEDYFGIRYPLPKLDLIAVPDFAAGAMENWGAITFRENLLLHFPDITSRSGEERICEVIAHEIAHQWFGNLVTPSDWKYLWLNESFATFFAYGAVDHHHPEWEMWDHFLEVQTDPALRRDALHETFPIEIPGGEHVVINASTAPIIYNKGGSILGQIRGFLGREVFREGLRRYLKKHQYGCASSQDLWDALGKVSREPVTDLMKGWIEQPGYPLVEVRRDKERLLLAQRRFTYLPNQSEQTWMIPLTVRTFNEDGSSEAKSLLLKDKEGEVHLGGNCVAYKLNDGQTGFYKVRYLLGEDLKPLVDLISKGVLSSRDRWGLQNDLYAMVMGGRASLEEYLAFLLHYEKEVDFLPVLSIAGNLYHAYLVFDGERRGEVASTGARFLERVLSSIGFRPEQGEREALSILRDQILFDAVLYGSKEAGAFAEEQFSLLLRSGSVHPDLARSIMRAGALKGDEKVLGWLLKRLEDTQSEHERMNILAALGCFSDYRLIERVQRFVLHEVPGRNKFIPLVSMAANPSAAPRLWVWFLENLEALERFHPIHFERVIAAMVPVSGLGREEEVNRFFDRYLQREQRVKDVVRLSLEKLKIHSRMRGNGLF